MSLNLSHINAETPKGICISPDGQKIQERMMTEIEE